MSEAAASSGPSRARSFGPVADAYDRARPGYPDDAVGWLVGPRPAAGRALVLELGAGTGKLTESLVRAGHDVVATDPLPAMLTRLAARVPVQPVAAGAERIPLPSRSADVVVCGQSFHWFDHERAMPEIARVLRPGGHLALAWNTYDVAIPWVKRLSTLLSPAGTGTGEAIEDPRVFPFVQTPYFGFVEHREFRIWQPHTAASLADLARSVSHVATMDDAEREAVLAQVAELYDGYGRGHDGMQVPYLTKCYRAVVRHDALPPERPVSLSGGPGDGPKDPPKDGPGDGSGDPGMPLIDFR